MNIQHLVFAPAALVFGLWGVVRSPAPAIASAGVCGLITRQEAAAALGAPVPAGAENIVYAPLMGRSVKLEFCRYGTEVSVARYALGPEATSLFGKYRQSLLDEGYLNVKGVGDEAFIAKGQLAARVGNTGLIVDVGQARGGGAPEQRAETALAKLAISRM